MDTPTLAPLAAIYRRTLDWTLELTSGLSEDDIGWRPSPAAPPIAFHLWHLARHADQLQATVSDHRRQLWDRERLAEQWGYTRSELGSGETGTGMEDDAFGRLAFPGMGPLMDYVQRSFRSASMAVESLDNEALDTVPDTSGDGPGAERTLALLITHALTHDNRHLGMIEALLGVKGLRGTATS